MGSLLDRAKRTAPATPAEFIAGADTAPSPAPQPEPPRGAAPSAPPVSGGALDPLAVPRYTFNVRLNDYQLELLRSIAAASRPKQSMQEIVHAGLIPYLEHLAAQLR